MDNASCNSLLKRANRVFGESLSGVESMCSRYYVREDPIYACIALVMELCMELQYPALALTGTVYWIDEVLKCFQLDDVEDIKKAVPAHVVCCVRIEGRGLNQNIDLGLNAPKLFYYIARLFCIAARRYERLQEPLRAKGAYVTASLYIRASSESLQERKKDAAKLLTDSLPLLLFDRATVPTAYGYNIDAAVECYYEVGEKQLERMQNKVGTKIRVLSETKEA